MVFVAGSSIVANSTGGSDCENHDSTVIDDGTCITDPTSFSGDPITAQVCLRLPRSTILDLDSSH